MLPDPPGTYFFDAIEEPNEQQEQFFDAADCKNDNAIDSSNNNNNRTTLLIRFANLNLDVNYIENLGPPKPKRSKLSFKQLTACFLSHLDYETLTGQDRPFDTLEYARHISRLARADTYAIPEATSERTKGLDHNDDAEVDKTAIQNPKPTVTDTGELEPVWEPDKDAIPSKELHDIKMDNTVQPLEDEIAMSQEEGITEPVYHKMVRAKHNTSEPESLRKYLANFPLRVVKETLKRTTQLAKTTFSYPLVRHVKSRFPWLNRFRLNEKVSTDTVFANCRAVQGETCAQIFYGLTSHVINVYGMKSESEFPTSAYPDFLRHEGIPTILRRD